MKTMLRSVSVMAAVTAFHVSKAQEFHIGDCRPRAFALQVQARIDDALNRKDLSHEGPTLTMDELQYLQDRASECDKTYYGPQRDKFNSRITELKSELSQKTATLNKEAAQKSALCKDPGAQNCRAEVKAAFNEAITKVQSEFNRDVDFYTGQIKLMESDRFTNVLPAYKTVLFLDQLAELLKASLNSSQNAPKLDAVKISIRGDDGKILSKDGVIEDMSRYLSENEKTALRQKYGTPFPQSLASRCDQEICLDPELIYARFNTGEERAGEVVADWSDANFTHEAVLDFDLKGPWTKDTLEEASGIFWHPGTELKLHNSTDHSEEIGTLKLTVKDQLLPSLQPGPVGSGK